MSINVSVTPSSNTSVQISSISSSNIQVGGLDNIPNIQIGSSINYPIEVSSTDGPIINIGGEKPIHNELAELNGGAVNEYYHLTQNQYFNLTTGDVIRPTQTGQFYPASNPLGFITGIDLSSYATITYTTGVSGSLQSQITNINNQTGSYYLNTNPSGYITGINNIVYTTGDQTISGIKTFATGVNISGNVGIGTTTPSDKLEVIGSISANSTADTYTLQNKDTSTLQSAFERVRGWLVWSYNSFIGRLKTANITAARDWLLPNSSGTVTVTTLTDGSISAEETFRTALYREMMWMSLQARRLFSTGTSSLYGGSTTAANYLSVGATTGTSLIGARAVAVWETGMSYQGGTGASWRIPTSFSVSGSFSSNLATYTSTTSNIISGSKSFLLDGGSTPANNSFLVGVRIWSDYFPQGTRITTVAGQTITVDQFATGNGPTNSPITGTYDGVNRLVLGTTNNVTNFNNQCCNSIATTNNMLVATGYASGATQIVVSAPITFTASGVSGNTFITATATPTGVVTGMIVSGNGIPANTIVTSVAGTQINLNTTLAGNVTSITVGFAPTMIAASTSAMGPAAYVASGTSGDNYITLTTTPIGFSGSGVGYIVSGSGITAGTTITSIVGTRINLSTTLAGNVSNITVTFMQSSAVLAYAYAYGIPDNTKISSITSSTVSSNIIINLDTAVMGDPRYNTGFVGQVGTPFVYQTSTVNNAVNNDIFIEWRPNPSNGITQLRIGYQRSGRMFYSDFASIPQGDATGTIQYYYQFILDYSSTTNKLRLWASRSLANSSTVPARPLQSNVLIELSTPTDLVDKNTNVYWGVHSCDDGVKPPFNAFAHNISFRDVYYYPFTTAV